MFVDLDWPLNASSLLSASTELLVIIFLERFFYIYGLIDWLTVHSVVGTSRSLMECIDAADAQCRGILSYHSSRRLAFSTIARCQCSTNASVDFSSSDFKQLQPSSMSSETEVRLGQAFIYHASQKNRTSHTLAHNLPKLWTGVGCRVFWTHRVECSGRRV